MNEEGKFRYFLRHPFWQAVLVLLGSYIMFEYVIGYLLPLLGVASAPVPRSVIVQYMGTVLLGVLLFVSAREERWRRFQDPIRRTLAEPERRTQRTILLAAVPLLAGWMTYQAVAPSYGAPATLRSVHPAPPSQITFRGETVRLPGLENPLRHEGSLEEHFRRGAALYSQNCVACHGDRLAGDGHFARMFNPLPADFTSAGTLPQLTESYVFWRIIKGGPGLPREGAPWNSAMPAWEDILDQDEIWATIIFLYEQTGASPRTWEEMEEGE